MTPLRAKMIRELELHRKSPETIEAYVTAVAQLACEVSGEVQALEHTVDLATDGERALPVRRPGAVVVPGVRLERRVH